MDYLAFVVLLLTAVFGFVSSSISWDRQNIVVNQGEDLTITCSLSNHGHFDVAKTELRKADGTLFAISGNNDLKPMFSNTGRYHLTFEKQDPGATVTLKYTGIRGEDSGTVSCFSMEDPTKKANTTIYVKVPLKVVTMQVVTGRTHKDIASGEKFRMIEGQTTGVTCIALMGGTVKPPVMKLTLEGQDITDQFERKEEPLVVNSGDSLPEEGTKVTYSYITTHPDRHFNRKQLHCSATAVDGDKKDAYIFLDVYYAPVLSCKTTEYFAQVDKSVSITCDLRSNPGANVTYIYSGQDGEVFLKDHQAHDQYRIEAKPISDDHIRIHISIHSVKDSHFGRYFIRAQSDYGNGQTEFLLHRGATEIDIEPTPDVVIPPEVTKSSTKKSSISSTSEETKTINPNHINVEIREPLESRSSSGFSSMKCNNKQLQIISLGLLIFISVYWNNL